MTLTIITFILGFVALILGAHWLVNGAISLGIRAKLSPMVIGLTVVAFGTSLPELVVNVFASFKGNPELAIGNILGSNIMNILLIVGISALIFPIPVDRISLYRDIPVGVFATVLLGFLANEFFVGGTGGYIGRIDGIVLLLCFGVYLWFALRSGKIPDVDLPENPKIHTTAKIVFLIFIGVFGLYLGGTWVSDGAVEIAGLLGISQSAIGLTIVAAATSLPELVTSIVAALKKNVDIVMGNVLGSNIINIFIVLGVSALIHPLPFQPQMNTEVIMTLLANVVIVLAIFIGKGKRISRLEGIILIAAYIAFVTFSLKA